MKLKLSNHIRTLILVNLVLYLVSCKKMDATYSEYIKGGEIVYVSKPDSLKAYAGKNRILLAWPIGTDPKVSKARIFWNNKENSTEYIIDRSSAIDTAKVWLNNMPEGSYSFNALSYDSKGNSSVSVNVQGNVYGENYNKSIVNRKYRTITYQNPSLLINWYDGMPGCKAVELSYTDQQNKSHTILIPVAEKLSTIPNFKSGSTIEYRTLFTPEPTALDIFYTLPVKITP